MAHDNGIVAMTEHQQNVREIAKVMWLINTWVNVFASAITFALILHMRYTPVKMESKLKINLYL